MPMRQWLGLAVVTAALTAGCAGMRDEMMMKKSLYERLGGTPAITAVVDDFVANVAADSRINGRFAGTNIPRLKTLLVDQVCEATGGPCKYQGRDMKSAHAGMGITNAEFNALVEDLANHSTRSGSPRRKRASCSTLSTACDRRSSVSSGDGAHTTSPGPHRGGRPRVVPPLPAVHEELVLVTAWGELQRDRPRLEVRIVL